MHLHIRSDEDAFPDAARIRVESVPAALDCGDCLSYALAKILAVPLLFKGNDFARTDLAAV